MLSKTFLHIAGIGPKTERRIWERGVHCWGEFLKEPSAAGLSPGKTERATETIALSLESLRKEDHRFFARALPPREHWRAFPEFSYRIAYLDIETTGMCEWDAVTLIGIYDGRETRIYTKGEDLQQFLDDIGQYSLLVTFHGACFDLPFLRQRFPQIKFDQLHIDLCPALRRLGLTGGLKKIEQQLGLARSPETEGLDGWDAVRLWREWERGSQEALELLKAYNREDVVNLEVLMQYVYKELSVKTGIPSELTANVSMEAGV